MPVGHPWHPEEEVVLNSIKKHQGVLTRVMQELVVAPATLYTWLRARPHLGAFLAECREDYVRSRTHDAESVVSYCMRIAKEKPNVALNAAMYHLNNQAKKQGYNHPEAERKEAPIHVHLNSPTTDSEYSLSRRDSSQT